MQEVFLPRPGLNLGNLTQFGEHMQTPASVQITNSILDRVDAIAAKLGVAANHLYAVYVHQAFVVGIQDLIVAAVCLILFSIGLYKAKSFVKWDLDHEYGSRGVLSFCGAVVITLSLTFGIIYATSAISPLVNPEYWAMQQIISQLKGN